MNTSRYKFHDTCKFQAKFTIISTCNKGCKEHFIARPCSLLIILARNKKTWTFARRIHKDTYDMCYYWYYWHLLTALIGIPLFTTTSSTSSGEVGVPWWSMVSGVVHRTSGWLVIYRPKLGMTETSQNCLAICERHLGSATKEPKAIKISQLNQTNKR